MLKGKKILLGVTASIAAYKVAILIRLLRKAGAEVKVIMTSASKEFISPLTLSTLSNNPVISDLAVNDAWSNHVILGRWADVMLIAPLSCNTLAKMAAGICDNFLLAVYLSSTCKVVVAPAMDEDMWMHPSTKMNLSKIESYGNLIIPVETGELASGLVGEGRMAEPDNILSWLNNFFTIDLPLSGKRALVTAGPTYEQIDPVRFIGNYSSGKMGIAIASELKNQGAEVTLVIGPTSTPVPVFPKVVHVKTAVEMFESCVADFKDVDITVMCAAVADYTPVKFENEKIKKSDEDITVVFRKTKDILKHLGTIKRNNQLLIGFALETNDEANYAKRKLLEKNADMIVLNSLNDEGAGFGFNTNRITIFDKSGKVQAYDTKSKQAVAKDIVNAIIQSYDENQV